MQVLFFHQNSPLFGYNPKSGEFWWKKRTCNRIRAGDKIENFDDYGYVRFVYRGKYIRAHRAAFKIMTGKWPREVDHINGDRSDNRWENLRIVDRSENQRNARRRKNNTSGLMGVSYHRQKGKWVARIYHSGARVNLGDYDNFFDACCARKSAEKRYGYHTNHGRG